jgi:hypothetical protein
MKISSRILFLDIDGVLNSTRTDLALSGLPQGVSVEDMPKFDWAAVGLVRLLCEREGVDIVLSSDWRKKFTAQQIAQALDLPVVDVTPRLPDCRGAEIKAWLREHPNTKYYAIADDNGGMLAEQQDHFVQTNPNNGLSYEDFRALQRILTGDLGGKHHNALFWE